MIVQSLRLPHVYLISLNGVFEIVVGVLPKMKGTNYTTIPEFPCCVTKKGISCLI